MNPYRYVMVDTQSRPPKRWGWDDERGEWVLLARRANRPGAEARRKAAARRHGGAAPR